MTTIPDGSVAVPASEAGQERGRTTVTPQALNRLVGAVTADVFAISPRAVHVDLSDQDGLLALSIRTPVRVIALNRFRELAVVSQTRQDTLLQRVAAAQTTVRDRVTTLAGAEVVHVTIRVTGTETEEERRVT